jgi:hypothetical protein
MTGSGDLSQAHEIRVGIEGARVLPANTPGGFTGLVFNSAPGSDAQPGGNFADIPIENLGTPLMATASVTQVGADGRAHAGQSVIFTTSAQLDLDRHCVRVYFNLDSNSPSPVNIQVMIGHVP